MVLLRPEQVAEGTKSLSTDSRHRDVVRRICAHVQPRDVVAAARAVIAVLILGFHFPTASHAQVELPAPSPNDRITIAADSGSRWTEGVYEVWLLKGDCVVHQGTTHARSKEAVLWIERGGPLGSPPHKVIAYLEDDVIVGLVEEPTAADAKEAKATVKDKSWLGRFRSTGDPELRIRQVSAEPQIKPAIYRNAMDRRDPTKRGTIQRTQFAEFGSTAPGTAQIDAPPIGGRRIRVLPRSSIGPQLTSKVDRERNETIACLTGGVNVIIDGVETAAGPGGMSFSGLLDISADNIVIWYAGTDLNLTAGESVQQQDVPLEIYMERNIVFREGNRVIEAEAMYYDVRRRVGTVLAAEVTTPASSFAGMIKLRAAAVQIIDQSRFVAQDASVTTSRLADPTYEVRSGSVLFEDNQTPVVDPITGAPAIDPTTGQPLMAGDQRLTAQNNSIYLEGFPIFYWPVLSTNLEEPTVYIERIQFKNDGVFGTQILTDFDAYEILGIEDPPEGTDWTVSLDYLSKRGPAIGTNFSYDRHIVFGEAGRQFGFIDAWFINDDGLDDLGRNRMDLEPEKNFRGRIRGQHKQPLPNDWTLQAELGYITDRNFMEQYFEQEWDEQKDLTTGFLLDRTLDNSSWTVQANGSLNDFFLETEWLPRTDHFWIGQPLLNDTLTWYEHSHIGYARQDIAEFPEDPREQALYSILPYEADVQGERVATRQEIDYPFDAGIVKVVPYVLGEAAHWGETLDMEDNQRLYGQVGIRASMPMWSVDPLVESHLFNVHGLAHKIVYELQFEHTQANRAVDEFPLYDEIDDNNIQQFRRRIPFDVFDGSPVPDRFDERFFGVRTGLQNWVSGPTEIVDDMTALRMGVRQRWQTKRGMPGNRHIIDWITLDTRGVIFDAEDNFGENLGLLGYDFTWHVGDRTTVVSSAEADLFEEGQRTFNVGGFLTRPPRGSIFLGFRSLEGPIKSNVLAASYIYRMSPKWVSSFGTTFDLSDENIGQHFEISRLGESFNVSLGANVDAGRDNFGIGLNVEPRFLGRSRLSRAGGFQVPVAGQYGLE